MSDLTLQEILLALTFVLTAVNIINSVNTAKSTKARQLMDDPKIIIMHKDIEYIRLAVDSQGDIIRQRSGLVDGEIKELRERVIKLEAIKQ